MVTVADQEAPHCQIYYFIDLWLTLPRLTGPPSRGVNLSWITIVITAVYLMSHVMISSMTTIEFLLLQLGVYFFCVVVFTTSTSLFRAFGACWTFCDQFLILSSRVPYTFSRFSFSFGIEFVEYHDIEHIYLISLFLPVVFMTCPLARLHPIIRYVL